MDLGDQPHCNRFLLPEDPDPPSYPLRVWFCPDCTLVQIDTTIPKEQLYLDYPYVSGTTATLVKHFAESASRLEMKYLSPGDLVVDIGSNDGTWLAQYASSTRILGVDPSSVAQTAKVQTIVDFFDEGVASEIFMGHGRAKLITAAGVFFHLEDLHSVCEGVRILLKDEGVIVIQVIYLGGMVQNTVFDQIYHEHLCYYTVKSLSALLAAHGLRVFHAQLLPIHGGTLEVHAAKGSYRPLSPGLIQLWQWEMDMKLDRMETYVRFNERSCEKGERLAGLLHRYREEGKSVFAYSAPAKGTTLLNSFGIDTSLVSCAVEKNPLKFGRVIPGCRIPIVDEAEAPIPDVYLLLAWNFAAEIFAKNPGRTFLVPFPETREVRA